MTSAFPSLPCSPSTSLSAVWKSGTGGPLEQFGNRSLIVASLFCKQELEVHTFMSVFRGPEMNQAHAVARSSPLANICYVVESVTRGPGVWGPRVVCLAGRRDIMGQLGSINGTLSPYRAWKTASSFSVSMKYKTLFLFCDGIPWPLYTKTLLETLTFSDLIKCQ